MVDGDVAQIDHLIINRVAGLFLLETKNYACNLVINDHGEFTAEYDNARFGIASPIEQSHRHERILIKLLERWEITGRTQKQPDFNHVVLLHPKATIDRPSSKTFDTAHVIKADQFPSWHQKFVDDISVSGVFKAALNMRSTDTIKEWGEKLMRQHRPEDFLALPDFMHPHEHEKVAAPKPTKPLQNIEQSAVSPQPVADAQTLSITAGQSTGQHPPAKKLICAQCGIKIGFPEGKFCWNNEKPFGGLQYCREHQTTVGRTDA